MCTIMLEYKHVPMLTDNATHCNGSDTTLPTHSPIALLHVLLLGHLIDLYFSSPVAHGQEQ